MINLPPLEFSYGVVEKALATAYGVSDAVRPKGFRSLLSSLQKQGALGAQARVGRGAALVYGPVELHRIVLTLELSELGLPPSTAVGLVDRYWKANLKAIVDFAARPIGLDPEQPRDNDVILYLGGVGLRTGSLRGEKRPSAPIIERCSLAELPAAMARWMSIAQGERGLVVNLREAS